jgi:hypothetical protein
VRTTRKSPLLPSSDVVIERRGELGGEGPTVYVFADVLDEVLFHAGYRDEPAMSLLMGGSYEGPAGPFIEIVGFTTSRYVDSHKEAGVEIGRHYPRMLESPDANGPQVLGWSYGAMGSQAGVDVDALRVHLTWFNLPQHVFLSVDPADKKYGIYRRSSTGSMVNIGFNLVRAQPSEQEEDHVEDR